MLVLQVASGVFVGLMATALAIWFIGTIDAYLNYNCGRMPEQRVTFPVWWNRQRRRLPKCWVWTMPGMRNEPRHQ